MTYARPRHLRSPAICSWLVTLALLHQAAGQLVNDGATNTLTNSTNSLSGNLTIGTNGSFTLLVLTNSALLTNSGDGTIGRNTGANSNHVRLHGPGARWQLNGTLFVGSNGSYNRLTVSNGAQVSANRGYVGFGSTSSNNEVVVGGTGSAWTNTLDMLVGVDGSWNRLIISNGGLVGDRHGELGINAASRSNEAIVTGIGSYWSNRGSMSIGVSGSGNRLIISNGGLVGNLDGYFGDFTAGSGTNMAIVTGTGSLWSNRGDLYLGLGSTGNQLIVSNGGGVFVSNNAYLGLASTGGSNFTLVTDSGSFLSISNEFYVGNSNSGNRLIISNGGLVQSGLSYIGDMPGAFSNEVVITGVGSVWTNRGLSVGRVGDSNRLTVSAGGKVNAYSVIVGTASQGNEALVTGTGSSLQVASQLTVGNTGRGNRLTITNGGSVLVATNTYIGNSSTGSNNVVVITGSGTSWTNTQQLYVGNAGSANQLTLENGAQLSSGFAVVGGLGGNSNVVVVSGSNSIWRNNNSFDVGNSGDGNRLMITNGGTLISGQGNLGFAAGSDSNDVMVAGTGSTWSNTSIIIVGYNGSANRFTVSNGGWVASLGGELGFGTSSGSNTAVVTGAGSVWSNALELFVGDQGDGNRLIVSNGGTVIASTVYLSEKQTSATNNRIVVDGGTLKVVNTPGNGVLDIRNGTNQFNSGLIEADRLVMTNAAGFFEFNGGTLITRGATISNGADFVVGDSGPVPATWDVRAGASHYVNNSLVIGQDVSSNRLLITNGALVGANRGYLGFSAASSNNEAVIASGGSAWTNTLDVYAGLDGSWNRLVISNGGLLGDRNGGLGYSAVSRSNEVIVTGTGSYWSNRSSLSVGVSGSGNRLLVSNGGLVGNLDGYFGDFTTGSGTNTTIVTGTGSLWSNRGDLYLGLGSSGNQLIVSNGGGVSVNGFTYLGLLSTGGGNSALITDSGSLLNLGNSLLLGYSNSGNSLVISNGGMVQNTSGEIGIDAGASNNMAMVTGTGSLWSNAFTLLIGSSSRGNQLVVNNGGAIKSYDGSIGGWPNANNNSVVITGAGSRWINGGTLSLGNASADNLLIVSNGGTLLVSNLTSIGSTSGASNNLAIITGPGTTLTSGQTLVVGGDGSANQLIVSNEGSVLASSVILSLATGTATNNRLVVDGGTLTVTNVAGNGTLNLRNGTNQFNSGLEEADRLVMTNGAGYFEFNGGTLITRGALISNGADFVVGAGGAVPATWDVRAGGSHYVNNSLIVGLSNSADRLLVTNGALLSANRGYVGFGATSSNNEAVIAGVGSAWTNTLDTLVGFDGSWNRLVISNGGLVGNRHGELGLSANSRSNEAIVTGAGSYWSNRGSMSVGVAGSGNRLIVSNGGLVGDLDGYFGDFTTGSGTNMAIVTGAGSLWSNRGDMYLGLGSTGNQLLVSNGGGVFVSNIAYLGLGATGGSNSALVTDAGSLWNIKSNLFVGYSNSGNRLTISNGARVQNFDGRIGYSLGTSNNEVTVTGAGSTWSNSGVVVIGQLGNFSRLTVSAGASVAAISGTLGGVSSSNAAVISDAGSAWSMPGILTVGNLGVGNQFYISNGAAVSANAGHLGEDTFSSNNLAVIIGAGSTWTNALDVLVGVDGSGNRLIISNGGFVGGRHGELGLNALSRSNEAIVTGVGSYWSNRGSVSVGVAGGGNRLIVSNGGLVGNLDGYFGDATVGSGTNSAIVTGAGSLWSNRGDLYLGYGSGGNQLLVSNGGAVLVATNAFIGNLAASSNNVLVLSGPGTVFTNSQRIYVGNFGSGNRVSVEAGALLASVTTSMGSTGGNSNEVLVTGPGSLWRNSSWIDIGNGGDANRLVVSNGGGVISDTADLGFFSGSDRNQAIITGAGSFWSNQTTLAVGNGGSLNQLIVSNGGLVSASNLVLSLNVGTAADNRIVVDGGTLQAKNASSTGRLDLRNGTNQFNSGLMDVDFLLMTNFSGIFEFNGGTLISRGGFIRRSGFISTAPPFSIGSGGVNPAVWDLRAGGSNTVVQSQVILGVTTSSNRLLLTNGAVLSNWSTAIGFGATASNNEALAAGPGSVWNVQSDFYIGQAGSFNRLIVSNGAAVTASNIFLSLDLATATNNRLVVDGGVLRTTNANRTGTLDLRNGTNVLNNGGLIEVDRLLITNNGGAFEFNGGMLNVRTATVANAQTFFVGNGTSPAVLNLVSNGTHTFANGLTLRTNAALTGNGTILGSVTNFGALSVGNSAGALRIQGDLRLRNSASLTFEIGGLIATNDYDQLTVTSFAELAGTLSLTLINGFYPDPTNTFTLMKFASFSGEFANVPLAGARITTTSNLASFYVSYSGTNVVIGNVQYPDSDGDGQADLEELNAGTDPNNPQSYLHITSITRDTLGRYVLQFQSVSGKNYRVEYSNDLVTWQTVAGPFFTSPGAGVTQWIDDGLLTGGLTIGNRFYRIGLQ